MAISNRFIQGGAETYLRTLIPSLRARRHDVGLLHETAADLSQPTIDAGDETLPRWGTADMGLPAVLQAVADWQPQLVYVHGLAEPALEDALTQRYRTVLYAHNYYGTCATGTKCHSWPSIQPCSRTLGPMCLLLHYPRRCGGLSPLNLWHEYRLQVERSRFLFRYHAVLVSSQHMHAEYLRHGLPADRVHCVPLFPSDVTPDPQPPTAHSWTNRLLMIGRLTRPKGGSMLLEALPQAERALGRRLQVAVAGDGPERAGWQQYARQRGIDVEFFGWVGGTRLDELKRQADLLAVPSLWPEPFGMVGIEAGCVGLPAVGYATGGIPDWLIPGESGESAPGDPPSADGLAEAIVRALRDPEHYQRLRIGAWKMAQRFSLRRHLELLEPILAHAAHG